MICNIYSTGCWKPIFPEIKSYHDLNNEPLLSESQVSSALSYRGEGEGYYCIILYCVHLLNILTHLINTSQAAQV